MKKNIFISYSDDDKDKMDMLSEEINTQIFNPIIVAKKSNITWTTLIDKVVDGIEKTHYFVPILTRKSISAQWINQEIGYSKARKISFVPIVETQIIKKLKGFIHKEFALEYQFNGDKNNGAIELSSYKECVKKLLHDLEESNLFIRLNEVDEQFNNQIRNSRLLGVENKSRWLLIDNNLHCIHDGDTFKYIRRNFINGKKEPTEYVDEAFLNQFTRGRAIKI